MCLCGFLRVRAEFDRTDATVYCRAGHKEQGDGQSESRVPAAPRSFWKVWVVKVDLDEANTERGFEVRQKASNSCRALLKVSEPGKNTRLCSWEDTQHCYTEQWSGQRSLDHDVTSGCGTSSSGSGMDERFCPVASVRNKGES